MRKKLSLPPKTLSCILSQFLWHAKYSKFENKPVDFLKSPKRFIFHLDNFKDGDNLKIEFSLTGDMYFQWTQLTDAITSSWKEIVKKDSNVNNDLHTLDHHLINF